MLFGNTYCINCNRSTVYRARRSGALEAAQFNTRRSGAVEAAQLDTGTMSHVSFKISNLGPHETHIVELHIDDILMLLHSTVREIRATPMNMSVSHSSPPAFSQTGLIPMTPRPGIKPPPITPRPQIKLQFVGHEKDIIELSYFSSSTFKYVKGDLSFNIFNDKTRGTEKKLIKTIYLNLLEEGKWTHLATLLKRDITDAPKDYLFNGILKLTITLKVMTNIITEPADKSQSSDVNKFLNMKPSADAVIVIKSKDGQEYNVHKTILASRSAVLKADFDHGTTESQTNVVEAPFESAVLEEVLSYMYSGVIPGMKKLAKGILAAADYYQLDGLKSLCEEELGEQLTADNANEMFELANSFQALMLKRWSSEFTKKLEFCQKLNAEWKLEYYI